MSEKMGTPDQIERRGLIHGMSLQTRREWLGLAGAAVVGGGGLRALAAGAAAKETLRVAAARIGVRYGSDSDMQFAHAPPEYAALFAEQCELYAPNLSWATVTPNRGGADPLREESNVAFAAEHGLKLTGFHLLWHLRTPKWVEELTSADEMRTAIADHIAAMGRHYGDRVYSWNVANESLSPGWMGPQERRARQPLPHAGLRKAGPGRLRSRVPRGAGGAAQGPAGV